MLAIGLAFVALYAHRLPAWLKRTSAPIVAPLTVVRRAHSGHVGDYVAWFVVGVALLDGLIGVPLR